MAAGDPRRRCLTFETPRPARVRKSRGRASEDLPPASGPETLLSPPGPRPPPRRRRASDVPAALAGAPETPDLGAFGELTASWAALGGKSGTQGACGS